jgi:hypothetical protein
MGATFKKKSSDSLLPLINEDAVQGRSFILEMNAVKQNYRIIRSSLFLILSTKGEML